MSDDSFQPEVIWKPQPGPQEALVACPVFEVFFGGARGGGKTEGSIGDWLQHSAQWGELASGLFVRRKFKQLEDVIRRTKQIFPKIGARYNETRAEWLMPGGATLRFRYIERDEDAEEYQGHSYTRVYVEEATNFPSPSPIDKLRATVRTASGAHAGFRLTGNPGGPGHQWVKHRYINPGPWKIVRDEYDFSAFGIGTQYLERVFIPSRVSDNQLLLQNDPTYLVRLKQSGSEALVKAWLDGNWDIIDGVYFSEWDPAVHVLPAAQWLQKIPRRATRFMAIDWGFAKPFSIGWYVVSDGSWGLPPGALLRYREWYGSNGKPNEGLRMEVPEVIQGIIWREQAANEDITYRVCDPAMYIKSRGPSIAEDFARAQLFMLPGDNKRIPGWQQVRNRLTGDAQGPKLFVLDNNEHLIRTLPTLQHDDKNSEDLDSDAEDHAADELRYACMSRPWAQGSVEMDLPSRPVSNDPGKMTFNDLVALRRRARMRAQAGL